jgi:hypothetical protein
MIEQGEKHEEYRRICDTWDKRIWDKRHTLKKVVLQLGYEKPVRFMEFKIDMIAKSMSSFATEDFVANTRKKISLDFKKEWGYNPDEPCYVIRLGERIYTTASNGTTAQEGKERR